ncbi:hypothetical protein cypCar_00019065 [Cyprinus carpio]|nr:hypothetical protein cypCar_00019065 [Cyprinus carpio]
MPTAVLLDSSLSMTRPVSVEGSEEFQRKNLAVHGLTMLFEHMATNYRLEFTSLVSFSSLWEVLVPFTRDYNTLQEALNNLEDYDKTCLEAALQGVSNIVQQEWGTSCPCQVVLVTDGALGIGRGSLRHSLQTVKQRVEDKKFPLPFPFPSKLYVMCIANAEEVVLVTDGALGIGRGSLRHSLQTVKQRVDDKKFPLPFPFPSKLYVMCIANAEELQATDSMDNLEQLINLNGGEDLEIVGFIEIGDISSPPVLSRHLVLPIAVNKEGDEIGTGATDDTEEETSTNQMAGKSPNFCVLLHGSLKVEGMVALVQLGPDWFGMLYSQADSKKKSNLMMSLFEPGSEPLPWLGRISQLGPASGQRHKYQLTMVLCLDELQMQLKIPMAKMTVKVLFPYSQNTKEAMLRMLPSGLKPVDCRQMYRKFSVMQGNCQKKHKPSIRWIFITFSELNRLRKAALAFGFWELLKSMAELLERECTLLSDSAHPDAAFQLSHAAQQLKLASSGDSKYAAYEHNITPMLTDFSGGGGAHRI